MRRRFLLIFMVVFSMFLFSNSLHAATDEYVSLEQGASIRTRTETSDQGLRFTAKLNENYKNNEHGFYLVFGETTIEELKSLINNGSNPLVINGKEVFKVEVSGLSEDGKYSVVLTGIPERGYLDGLTAIPYVVVNGVKEFSKAALTRSIAEVAISLQGSGHHNPVFDDIVNLVSDSKRLVADEDGKLRVASGVYETHLLHIKDEFIRDWNQMFLTNLTDFTASELHVETLKPSKVGSVGNQIFNNINLFKFFSSPKWGWILELLEDKATPGSSLANQVAVIKLYNGINPFNNELNELKDLVYSIANLLNESDEASADALSFTGSNNHELTKQYNDKVIINPKNYPNIYKGDQGITVPAFDESLTPEGYRFSHYTINGVRDVMVGQNITDLTDADVIEPKYELRNYNLRFHDGDTEIGNLRATYNVEANVVFPIPEKPGFDFVGWYDNPELNGDYIEGLNKGNTGHLNYYAKWESLGKTDEEKLNEAKDALNIGLIGTDSLSSVANNVSLPSAGLHDASITWETSNSSVVSKSGLVTRLAVDTQVTLTATLKLNDLTVTKAFQITIKKFDAQQEYTITFNLNGGAWPKAADKPGYTNRNEMIVDFLTDFYGFLQAEKAIDNDISLNDFMHGKGKTSGFDGLYGIYDGDKTTHFDYLYAANSKAVNPSSDKFINQPEFNKWVALLDLMEEYTSLGFDNEGAQQTFWGSKFIGARRIVPFMQEAKPAGSWNHIPIEDVKAITGKIPESLKGTIPGSTIEIPSKYTPASNDITLPTPEKSGDKFIGWYDNEAYQGSPVAKLVKGSTGNKVYYARWESTEVPSPVVEYTITFNLNGGAFGSSTAVPSVYTSESDAILLPVPTRNGYEFAGWCDNSNLSGTEVTHITKGSAGNKAYYAKWEAISTLTDAEKAVDAKNDLDITLSSGDTLTKVTKNVTLKTSGMHNAVITWATSNSNTISNAGVVKRGENDVTVTLTATIKVGSATETKTFTLTVLKEEKVDPNQEFTITLNLNGGSWPTGGYKNKTELATAFLTDLFAFVAPGGSLNDFMHGAGKTSGFAGTWYSNEEHRAKIFGANIKSGNNSYFLSHSTYGPKWKPFADFMENFVRVGNPDQDFWSSPYTGNLRLSQYFTNTKPSAAWEDTDMNAMPSGLSAFTPVTKYTPNDEVILQAPTKSGDKFVGWYDNKDLWGTAITKISKGSSGNKVYYARWESSVVVDPSLTPQERVTQAKADLAIGYASGDSASKVTANLTLKTTGLHATTIKWSSSNTAVISNAGVVTRGQAEVKVTLTATITSGSATDTKTFSLTVPKVENYTITYNLNGGTFAGYKNKTELATAFLTDLFAFVAPGGSLNDFMHGAGKTSGFAGTWYSNEEHRAKIFAANVKSGNNSYFLSHSTYGPKWKALADFMVTFVKVGNPDQDFWSSPFTGNLRLSQYFTNTKPGAAWSDEDMAKLPSGLSASVPYEYNPNALPLTLPTTTRSGYTFEGWYENANFSGSKVTSIAKGSTGNKVFYAKWSQPIYSITLNLNSGSIAKYSKANLADAFLNDLYSFIKPSDNLNTFKHGAGKTSGFDGTWYSNEEYRKLIYGINIQSGNNDYFLSSSLYQAKWKPLADFMVTFVSQGNPAQSFWPSPSTGTMRLWQYFRNVKPSAAWTDANMSATPNAITPKQFSGGSQAIILPPATRSGYTFEGWYTANTGGSKVTQIAANATGNQTFYARWKKVETPPPTSFPKPSVYVSITTGNAAYKANRWISVQGVVIHSTAVPGVMARSWISRHNAATNIGVHAWVDNKEAVQTLPWTMRGWHAGGSANNTHIGIEICEPAGHYYSGSTMVNYNIANNAAYFNAAYRNAVGLTIWLFKQYGLKTVNVTTLPGHSELGSRGSASADPMQWFPKHGKSMTTFRNDVRNNL